MVTSNPQLNILLVEDHDVLRELVKQALEEAGHSVTALSCAEELEDQAGAEPVDVFIIDLNLPGEQGLSLTERVRVAYPLAGVIILTARSRLEDKLEGYARGADLYLSKPIEVPELCAAVAAMGLRGRRVNTLMQPQGLAQFTLHQQQLRLSKSGCEPMALTAAEVSILVAFCRAPGQRVAYWQIAEMVGLDLNTSPKANLEVRMTRLRKKLVDAGAPASCIESVRNMGYQLCMPLQVI